MESVLWVGSGVSSGVLFAWSWMALFRGGYWRTNHRLRTGTLGDEARRPSVVAVIPARNEGEVLPETLPRVLGQAYSGLVRVIVVAEEGGGETAKAALRVAGQSELLEVMERRPLEPGWAGKVHALHQGIELASRDEPDYLWLTDADIAHEPDVLESLVAKADAEELDLVSVMAELRNDGFWERMLIPAYVYFFAMLYPFGPRTSGAAGGCMLVRRSVLESAGGYESIKGAIIDDCSMAARVVEQGRDGGRGRLWLGLSRQVRSVRGYGGLAGIWEMVARTAFDQLDYSWLRLVATVVGMVLLFGVPVVGTVIGAFASASGDSELAELVLFDTAIAAWALMAILYLPMLRYYRQGVVWAVAMPVTAGVYVAMTVGSAVRYWRGGGDGWRR